MEWSRVTYYLPDDYVGFVTVYFNQPCGVTPPLDNDGRWILNVPSTGIVILNSPKQGVYLDHLYYQYDAQQLTTLSHIEPHEAKGNSVLATQVGIMGRSSGQTNNSTIGKARWERFFVGSVEEWLAYDKRDSFDQAEHHLRLCRS